jgi:hypothetical protein
MGKHNIRKQSMKTHWRISRERAERFGKNQYGEELGAISMTILNSRHQPFG